MVPLSVVVVDGTVGVVSTFEESVAVVIVYLYFFTLLFIFFHLSFFAVTFVLDLTTYT